MDKINYKSPVQNWDYYANDWKYHGVQHALSSIEKGLQFACLEIRSISWAQS